MYSSIAKAFDIQNPVVGLIIRLVLDSTIFSTVTITGMTLFGVVWKRIGRRFPRLVGQELLLIRWSPHTVYFSLIVRFFLAGYFTVRSILEGTGLNGARDKLKTRFLSTLFGAWKFWPLANAVNFWFVPLQFRVLYMNVISLFWTGWLTYVNSKKIALPSNK